MSRNPDLDLVKWLGKGAKVSAPKENNLRQDRYDYTIYAEIRENSDKIRALEAAGANTFPALLQDFWAAFYKAAPEMEGEENVNTSHRINRPFVERLIDDRSTKEARITTMLDELSSAVAAIAAGKVILQEINEREKLRKAVELSQEAQAAEEEGNAEAASNIMAEAERILQAAARDTRAAVRTAVKTGQQEAEELRSVMAGWGIEPGDLSTVPIGNRLKLAAMLTANARMKRIAELVGKMRNLARARQRQKVKQRRDEIHSITTGAELHRMLPQEFGALRHPLRRLDFYRRFTEGMLLQYELRSEEKLARGPIIAAIDISGSMNGAPLEWAIAVALALADTASRQKRYCRVIFFDTKVQKEYSFAPGERNVEKYEKYAEIANIGPAGGTDYAPALSRARQFIAGGADIPRREKNEESADIVMVTDGICLLHKEYVEDFNGWRKEHGTSAYTILIGNDALNPLREWNDKVWRIPVLTGDSDSGEEVAGDLFEEIY